jgi:hypothetical protein
VNAHQAAKRVKKYLEQTYGADANCLVWTKAQVKEYGWGSGSADAQVCWEGGPYEWSVGISEAIYTGALDVPGVHCEAQNGFILNLYKER